MYYVYLLLYNEIPFYAGMSADPVRRYKLHFYSCDCNTYNLVRYNAQFIGRFPTMRLIFCDESKRKALNMEHLAISSLRKAAFSIVNIPFGGLVSDWPQYPSIKLDICGFPDHIFNQIRKQQELIHSEYGY